MNREPFHVGNQGAAVHHPLPGPILQVAANTGVKLDAGKPQMELLSAIATLEVAKVLTFGAKKYASHNWRGGIKYSRLLGAAARHLFAYIGGESKDPESGLSHLAHAACCLMFLLEFETTRPDLDDRYKPSVLPPDSKV